MRNFSRALLCVLPIAIVIGLAAYAFGWCLLPGPLSKICSNPNAEMVWLRREFHLSDEHFAKVMEIHRRHQRCCAELSPRIAAAQKNLETVWATQPISSPQAAQAWQTYQSLRADCIQSTVEYIQEVSGEMPAAESKRFKKLMLPKVFQGPVETYSGH